MTEEEKNEIYKEAFKCMLDNEKTSKDILSRFSLFETQYRHLNFQDYGNIRAFLDKEPTFQKLVRDTIDEKSKQNQIFENLKKAIEGEESIIEQIKALSRKRVVAVIGKNHELISGVFTYLWLTSPYCNNKPEGWLLPEIPIIRYFCSVIGEYMPNRIELLPLVLFIGLNVTEKKKNLYKIQEFLERRSNQINNIRSIYIQMGIQGSVGRERMVLLKDTNCESEVLNILVRMVSDGIMPVKEFVISMDTLPAEFKDQFEPIYLEPEKQDKTTDTPKKINKLFYSWNKENKFVLYSKKDKPVELTKKESKLILYLKEDRRTPEEIIEHLWGVYKTKDVRKKKNNIMELRNRLNMKCSKIGIENLISTLIDGCYCLNLEVEER